MDMAGRGGRRAGPGALGGSPGVRPSGAPRLAQAALALPCGELQGGLVHRDRTN